MRALTMAFARVLPLVAGAGLSVATVHTVVGLLTGIATALYTTFLAVESCYRIRQLREAHKEAKRSKSPRTKSDE